MKKSSSDSNLKHIDKLSIIDKDNTKKKEPENKKLVTQLEVKITELKQEINTLRNQLVFQKINQTSTVTEEKYKLLEEENILLNKKVECYAQENSLLRGKVNSLSQIINQNEQYRQEVQDKPNSTRYNYFIQNPRSQNSLKESLLQLNDALDLLSQDLPDFPEIKA